MATSPGPAKDLEKPQNCERWETHGRRQPKISLSRPAQTESDLPIHAVDLG